MTCQPVEKANPSPYAFRALNDAGVEVIPSKLLQKAVYIFKAIDRLYMSFTTKLEEASIEQIYIEMIHDPNAPPKNNDSQYTLRVEAQSLYRFFHQLEFTATGGITKTPAKTISKELNVQLLSQAHLFANALMMTIGENRPVFSPVQQVQDVEGIFTSKVYNSYFLQMKAFVKSLRGKYSQLFSSLDNPNGNAYAHPASDLLNFILNIDLSEKFALHKIHIRLIALLREGLTIRNDKRKAPFHFFKQCDDFIDEFIKWIYTGPNLDNDLWNHLQDKVPKLKDAPVISLEDVYSTFLSLVSDLKLIEHFHTACKDMYSRGYLPAALWDFMFSQSESAKVTKFIRMANPILKLGPRQFTITPEMVHFLRVLEKEGKTLLIVHFLSMDERNSQTSEPLMSKAIHELTTVHGIKNIKIYCVNRNGPFYHQERAYSDVHFKKDPFIPPLTNMANYKQQLLNELTEEHGEILCYWSEATNSQKKEEIKQRLDKCIQIVHSHYFKDAAELNSEQRNIFNELVYLELLDQDAELNMYDYITAFCQASADRGPSFLTLWRLKHLIDSCTPLHGEVLQQLLATLFGNALLTENRAIHPERALIFYKTAQVMLEAGPRYLS